MRKIYYCTHATYIVPQVEPPYTMDGCMQNMAEYACGEFISSVCAYIAVAQKMLREEGYDILEVDIPSR